MRKRIRLTVAYDGTNYHGWQLQDNGNSIEAELNRAIEELTGEKTLVIGASRTDAGVHSLGNIAVFDTGTRVPPEKLFRALNVRLPADIRVMRSEEVPEDWHPRRQDCRKTYEYRVAIGSVPVPTDRLYSYYIYHPADAEAMREAAGYLVGEHDFAAFCAAGSQAQSTVRTIYSVSVEERPGQPGGSVLAGRESPRRELSILVCGNGFLYNMVRILAGTLLEVGMGRKSPADIPRILESRDRRQAGPTLPPQGLFLVGYEYPGEHFGAMG